MRGYTAEQIRAAEKPLLEAGLPLMQRAATALAQEVRGLLDDHSIVISDAHVLVLVGAGDNGGDALFAAGRLADAGADVRIVPTADRVHDSGLSAAEDAGARLAVPVGSPQEACVEAARTAAETSDVVIDGILGTGTRPGPGAALRGTARAVVEAVNEVVGERSDFPVQSLDTASLTTTASTSAQASRDASGDRAHGIRPMVVAVDIPSGIDPDTGEVPDPTVLHADLTVTFGAAKAGLLQRPAKGYAGELSVIDIGLLGELVGVAPAYED
ncbi:NAD(P)H-hydrate epimerase [Pseudoclavibacter sp. 13-3]|uniref:NAD(P)H-hydrate epimerase n=1 Tax=Pseudoclavibacter sp. 13-3 TaxID=2901228 RepID=UPI001E56DC7E|nr:NAD(P)H-hydrate epimerase [Pseudoclavibacter sp. 13-3]MCD7101052.1 NAD(P)H-hydrate epimerase [Pseudoclavibacter sp. 13-3]